ncbi:hypothetical protein [Propionivibrio sp.]|uniref:hypothetical protein n=1 Tax=Propionivibrio sp. TaxID=2212460 RepID=UPI003BEFC2BD
MRVEIEHQEHTGSPLVTAKIYEGDELLETLTLCGTDDMDDADFETMALETYAAHQVPFVIKPPTQAEVIAKYESALDAHLDSVARLHRYDNRFTFALRAGFDGPYRAEAVLFAQWMDACNVAAYALIAEVKAGAAMPTIEEFIAGLPAFTP